MKIKYIPILFITALIMSCGKSKENNLGENKTKIKINMPVNEGLIKISIEQFENEKMSLERIQEISFPTFIRTTGTIDVPPKNRAIINTFIGGYIKSSPFLVGDKVKKGQALVKIENLEFIGMQQEYIEVLEQLKYLKSDYDRQKELYSEKITSKKNFLKAESIYKKTKAIYNGLEKKLKLLNFNIADIKNGKLSSVATIYSPITGSITDVQVSIGSFVSPSNKIMEIVNTDHIHLELKVFEKDILKVKEGQKVIFRMPESLNKSFVAVVHLIGKSIDENRMVQVHAHIENEYKHNFIVGMFVESDIVIGDATSKALPENAITDSNGKSYLLKLISKENDIYSFEKEEIIIGQTYNGFTEIKSKNSFSTSDQFLLGGFGLISEEE